MLGKNLFPAITGFSLRIESARLSDELIELVRGAGGSVHPLRVNLRLKDIDLAERIRFEYKHTNATVRVLFKKVDWLVGIGTWLSYDVHPGEADLAELVSKTQDSLLVIANSKENKGSLPAFQTHETYVFGRVGDAIYIRAWKRERARSVARLREIRGTPVFLSGGYATEFFLGIRGLKGCEEGLAAVRDYDWGSTNFCTNGVLYSRDRGPWVAHCSMTFTIDVKEEEDVAVPEELLESAARIFDKPGP